MERLRQHHEKERRDLDELKHAASAGDSDFPFKVIKRKVITQLGALLPVVDLKTKELWGCFDQT